MAKKDLKVQQKLVDKTNVAKNEQLLVKQQKFFKMLCNIGCDHRTPIAQKGFFNT